MKRAPQMLLWIGLGAGLAVGALKWPGGGSQATPAAETAEPVVAPAKPTQAARAVEAVQPAAPRATAQAPARDDEALSAVRAELESLKTAQTELARELELANAAAAQKQEAQAAEQAPVEVEEAEEVPVAQRELAQAVLLDELHQNEPACLKLRAEMATRVSEFFSAPEAQGSEVKSADCRTTLCRLEVGLADLDARDRMLNRISSLLPPDAEGYAYVEDASDLEIQVYLSRTGVTLPSPSSL